MRRLISILLVIGAPLAGLGQTWPPTRVKAGTQGPMRGTGVTTLDFEYVPQNLKELRDYSQVILEGTVQSKLAARQHGPGLEVDTFVSVDHVIKGDPALQNIVVTEQGGTLGAYQQIIQNDTPMKAGERYFFFLLADTRTDIPAIAGRNRYTVVCAWVGKARIIGNSVTISAAAPKSLVNSYDGIAADQFLTAILAQ